MSLSPTLIFFSELSVVIADGSLVTANNVENSDRMYNFLYCHHRVTFLLIVFWAMRGGGAGSWGVIVSATFQTFPTFDAAISFITISTNTTEKMGQVAEVHAKHIFDLDALRAGQNFFLSPKGVFPPSIISEPLNTGVPTVVISSFFPNSSLAQAAVALQPFIDDVQKVDGVNVKQRIFLQNINEALTIQDDLVGINMVLGSRLVPASAYKNPALVGEVYSQLLNTETIL